MRSIVYLLSTPQPSAMPKTSAGYVWMIDPLDGTKEFTHGSPRFSIMVGLAKAGVPTLGIVYAPASGEWWYAQQGKGAFYKKGSVLSKIHVSAISDLADARLVTRISGDKRELDVIVEALRVKEKMPEGSIGIKIGRIAQGDFDLHVNTNFRASKWDVCAGHAILNEAGGLISDLDGSPLNYLQDKTPLERSFIASNTLLHSLLLTEIKKVMPPAAR